MKKRLFAAMLAVLCLTGCAKGEDSFRVDTVVYIPADPTAADTEPIIRETQAEQEKQTSETSEPEATQEPEITEPQETTPPKKNSTTSKKNNTSSKKPSSGKNNTTAKPTEPTAEEPAQTQPTETEPIPTEIPGTEPEPTDPPLYDISGYSVGSLEHAIKDAVNAYRTEESMGELSMDSRLCAIASCRGYEISRVWSHTRPDGRSFKTVLSDYGYAGGTVKELLVYVSGSGDGAAIVDKWMGSDSHREWLLGGFSTIGVGVYRSNGYTYVACLLVG